MTDLDTSTEYVSCGSESEEEDESKYKLADDETVTLPLDANTSRALGNGTMPSVPEVVITAPKVERNSAPKEELENESESVDFLNMQMEEGEDSLHLEMSASGSSCCSPLGNSEDNSPTRHSDPTRIATDSCKYETDSIKAAAVPENGNLYSLPETEDRNAVMNETQSQIHKENSKPRRCDDYKETCVVKLERCDQVRVVKNEKPEEETVDNNPNVAATENTNDKGAVPSKQTDGLTETTPDVPVKRKRGRPFKKHSLSIDSPVTADGASVQSPDVKVVTSPIRRESSRRHMPKKMDPDFICTDTSHLRLPMSTYRGKQEGVSPASDNRRSTGENSGQKRQRLSTGGKVTGASPRRKRVSSQQAIDDKQADGKSDPETKVRICTKQFTDKTQNEENSSPKRSNSNDNQNEMSTPKKQLDSSFSPKSSPDSSVGGINTPRKKSFIKNRKAISGCVTYDPKELSAKKDKKDKNSEKGEKTSGKRKRKESSGEDVRVGDNMKRKRKRKKNVFESYESTNKRRKIATSPGNRKGKQLSNTRSVCRSCRVSHVTCACRVGSGCSHGGESARWCHISSQEHYCNNCFEYYYREKKPGFKIVAEWRERWLKHSKQMPKLKDFIVDQVLPYWVECTLCQKWRKLPQNTRLSPQFVRVYTCETGPKAEGEALIDCNTEEDPSVSVAKQRGFLNTISTPLCLKLHPALPFLRNHQLDIAGLSAHDTDVMEENEGTIKSEECSDMGVSSSPSDWEHNDYLSEEWGGLPKVRGVPRFLHPFTSASAPPHALALNPTHMDVEEERRFPQYASNQHAQYFYLGLRNLILAMWCRNCKEVLSWRQCCERLICRGLVRVHCMQALEGIVQHLTVRGLINTGVFTGIPASGLLTQSQSQTSVLVVGAGISGLAAARHLTNLGIKVTVLEVQNEAGGRIRDDRWDSVCVGRSAQTLNGSYNNPIALICHQCDLPVESITGECDLVNRNGQLVTYELDQRVECHFNEILDEVAEWRKVRSVKDANLMKKIEEIHRQLLKSNQINFSKDANDLMQFHCGNVEYASGAALDKLSAVHWDQNENFPQFLGEHLLLTDGFSRVIDSLGAGLNVRCNMKVTSVDYSGDSISVMADNLAFSGSQEEFHADHVIVTLPLHLLQKHTIEFNPPLPKRKEKAIRSLGVGQLEKVMLQFPVPFWRQSVSAGRFFGCVPDSPKTRGLFNLFCDVSNSVSDKTSPSAPVLVSYVCGAAIELIRDKTQAEVQQMCINTLQNMFPDQTIPTPTRFSVTNWQDSAHSGMAYSYLPVGLSGWEYTVMAETVDEKLHFAGEATNRQFPQSITGAYLSGIREATKIAESANKCNLTE